MKVPRWLKRTLKWLAGLVAGFILLISGALYFFHDEIVDYALEAINGKLRTKVEVSAVDITFWKTFPNLSLDFHEVFVQDALPHATRRDTLLYTDLIRLKFNPLDVWNEDYNVKSIDVAPGTLQLKIADDGEVNYDVLKPSEDDGKSSAFELTLEEINIEGMRFSYHNRKQEQFYATVFSQLGLSGKFTESRFDLHTEAAFRIQEIRNGKVPFVVNQPATTIVDIHVDQEKETVSLPDGIIHLAGLPFKVSVFVDSTSVKADVNAKDLPLADVANHLSVKEVEEVHKYKGQGTASFSLKLNSRLGADAFPFIDCKFDIRNGRLTEPTENLVLNAIQLNGRYSTLKGRNKEELDLSRIEFSTVGGPFSGNLSVRQFSAPRYTGKAKGAVDLAVIHSLFHLPKISTLTGTVNVNTEFALATINQPNGKQVIDIEKGSGQAQMSNVALQLIDDTRKFEQINGKMFIDQHQAALENLSVKLGSSDLLLNGHFDEIDRFLQDEADLGISVTAQSRRIDLADFNTISSGTSVKESGVRTREWLLPTMIAGNVMLDVGVINFNQHNFSGIHGNMSVGKRQLRIDDLLGKNAEATVRGKFAIRETSPEYFEMITSLSSQNIHFGPLFREWNNFDQEVITADNISGRAEVKLDFRAPFDLQKGVLKEQVEAVIGLRITNGALKNVGAFKELTESLRTPKTRVVLKKREIEALDGKLSNISFETLENVLTIRNSTIFIPSMEIKSSALDITTEGTHTFANRIDYRFAFRFRELKMQKDESEFGVVEDDGTGLKVYVRMYGDLDNPVIEWDKQGQKEQRIENRQAAKAEAMSILKSEFGFRKNDTNVKRYVPPTRQKETIEIQFDDVEEPDPVEEKKKSNKLMNSIKQKTEKIKQQQKKEEEIEFEID
jgi:hypothetical protein